MTAGSTISGHGDGQRRRLAAKNRYNIRTMGVFLFVRWLHVFLLTVLGMASVDFYDAFAHVAIGAFFALGLVVTAIYFVLVERCFTAFRALQPRICSIYDRTSGGTNASGRCLKQGPSRCSTAPRSRT